jgi:hypothetical protein
MPAAEKVKEVTATAKPTVQRLAKDKKFQDHAQSAYGSARTIYDELFSSVPPTTESAARRVVARLAQDPELQS